MAGLTRLTRFYKVVGVEGPADHNLFIFLL